MRDAPVEQEVRAAFEQALEGNPAAYATMDLEVFFYGWLVGKGWSGREAAAFVQANPVNADKGS